MRLSIVMPAHNEEAYLEPAVEEVVRGLRQRGESFELIISENGSPDATPAVAERLARAFPEVRVLRSPLPDYGRALRTGFLAAQGDIVVNFDVDLVDLGFLDQALALMSDPQVAVVVGSKRAAGALDDRSARRRAVTTAFSLVLRYVFGLHVSDTHGLKALQRAPLVALVEACRHGKDIFDTELILRTERAGLTVVEVPVAVKERRPARTPISRRIPSAVLGLAQLRIDLRREGGDRRRVAP